MFVLAIGLLARSAIGPVERLLNMLGHQNVCALAYALAFVMNLVLCIALVPRFGIYGAAASTSIALVFETILLFWITRQPARLPRAGVLEGQGGGCSVLPLVTRYSRAEALEP